MNTTPWMKLVCGAGCVIALCSAVAVPAMAGWTVTPRGSVLLDAGMVTNIRELSGVTYLGPQSGGLERFAAIQDENARIVVFDVSFTANGTINSATALSALTITGGPDFEGIAYTGPARNSVFVSEENTPTIREFQLPGGEFLQAVSLPDVFANARNNRGLESLTRSLDGQTMWTANEEALTVDGPASSQAAETIVRLQRLSDGAAGVELGPQFAYAVDPIHAGSNPDRSGLADLVMLPDDSLLTLERSRTGTGLTTSFRNRIYQVDFTAATDISGEEFGEGLSGETPFFPVDKGEPLWSAQSIGINNLEGLGLGPALSNGSWVLLGVVDDGGLNLNPVMSFELSLTGCSLDGDYNCNGAVDDADYRLWKNTFGAIDALAADGNASGTVDAADYTVWRDHLGDGFGAGSAGTSPSQTPVPEPGATALFAVIIACGLALSRKRRR